MSFPQVKQLFHPVFREFRYVLEPGMLNPVPGSVFNKRIVLQVVFGDRCIQV
jgi:hypothetical protein